MIKRLLACFAVVMLLAGCTEPVVFSEVFQLDQDDKLYTAYNLWYAPDNSISCLNIQQGKFIPLGTEIEPISTSSFPSEIRFRTVDDNREYTISFSDGYRLCSMREYISYTFTTQSQSELLTDIPEDAAKRICRGEVVVGMTPDQVKLTYGPPAKIRTPQEENESWIYWITPSENIRLVFRSGQVRNVLNLNQR